MVTLYREVEDMVKRVAVANNFSLVLQYGDVIKAEDAYNPRVIQQKVMSGMCLPMYAADGIDISPLPVYSYLNKDYKKASASCDSAVMEPGRWDAGRIHDPIGHLRSQGRREREQAHLSLPADHLPARLHPGHWFFDRQPGRCRISTGTAPQRDCIRAAPI